MNEVDNSESLKNAFLIQIYKSSYSTIVAEGMTFVVGISLLIQGISQVKRRRKS